jgi:hypothetical protein
LFKVQGLFQVPGFRFQVCYSSLELFFCVAEGARFKVQGSRFKVQRFRVQGSEFRVTPLGVIFALEQ